MSWNFDPEIEKESPHKLHRKCKHVGLEKVANISGSMIVDPNTDDFEKALLVNQLIIDIVTNDNFTRYTCGILT